MRLRNMLLQNNLTYIEPLQVAHLSFVHVLVSNKDSSDSDSGTDT
jgi:hypothetical protein